MAILTRILFRPAFVCKAKTANCQPCLQYHTNKAIEFGADAGEIAEAIEMGKRVRKGAAARMDEFSSGLKGSETTPKCSTRSACCS